MTFFIWWFLGMLPPLVIIGYVLGYCLARFKFEMQRAVVVVAAAGAFFLWMYAVTAPLLYRYIAPEYVPEVSKQTVEILIDVNLVCVPLILLAVGWHFFRKVVVTPEVIAYEGMENDIRRLRKDRKKR